MGGRRLPVVVEDTPTESHPHSAALTEWQTHIHCIQDQPREVMDSACRVFHQAYGRQPLSGNKARDPVKFTVGIVKGLLHR